MNFIFLKQNKCKICLEDTIGETLHACKCKYTIQNCSCVVVWYHIALLNSYFTLRFYSIVTLCYSFTQ